MTMRGGGSWLPFLGRRASTATARRETDQQALGEDDDWSDTFSESDNSTASSDDENRSVDSSAEISPEDEARLLPNMPTLFGTDLPPCGLIPQVAYENVVHRLRKLWLQHAAANPVAVNTLDICLLVQDDLDAEAEKSPPSTERGTKARKPWRRENVFEYEIKWAEYFAREARVQERKLSLSEAEQERQDFMDMLFPIPKELRIFIKNGVNKEGNLGLWRAWHQKRRQTQLDGGIEVLEEGEGEGPASSEDEATASRRNSNVPGINTPDTDREKEQDKHDKVRVDEEREA